MSLQVHRSQVHCSWKFRLRWKVSRNVITNGARKQVVCSMTVGNALISNSGSLQLLGDRVRPWSGPAVGEDVDVLLGPAEPHMSPICMGSDDVPGISTTRFWPCSASRAILHGAAFAEHLGEFAATCQSAVLAVLQYPQQVRAAASSAPRQVSHRYSQGIGNDTAIGIGDIGESDSECPIASRALDGDRQQIGLANKAGHEAVGRAIIDVGRACRTADMAPSRITQMRSASIIASSRSCVTWTKVTPTERCRRLSSACSTFFSLTSSADRGSSSSSNSGAETMERASATRCCSPPESSTRIAREIFGLELHELDHLADAPARSGPARFFAASRESRYSRPPSCAGTGPASETPCWSAAWRPERPPCPRRQWRCGPWFGSSKPAICLSKVVLPQPDGPTRATNSPLSTDERHAFQRLIAAIGLLDVPNVENGAAVIVGC